MIDLKPCPFCGWNAVLWDDDEAPTPRAGCYGNNPKFPHMFIRMTVGQWNGRPTFEEGAA